MPDIHHSAAVGYAATATTYVKRRPDYPPEVEAWLRDDLLFRKGRIALALGAGTGKFLPRLLRTDATVVAVEPVPAMLAQLADLNPGIETKLGSAENIPLPSPSTPSSVHSPFTGLPMRTLSTKSAGC